MHVSVDIEINSPAEAVWAAITDIENCAAILTAIINIEILHKPDHGIVGLQWRETRKMFGKEASETMWITQAVKNQYYCTRAESHGAIYTTKLALQEAGKKTLLTMAFSGEAQSLLAKAMSALMAGFISGSMQKALRQDLADIKHYVEKVSLGPESLRPE